MTEADAPGKLFIAGEYGVLGGGPGIVMAVDVRARARLEPLPGPLSELLLPDTGARYAFRWTAGGPPRWEGASPGDFGLPLEALAGAFVARGLWPRAAALPACRLSLSTAAFHHSDSRGQRRKLGLGSSAAVVVALGALLARHGRSRELARDELLTLCWDAHRRLQGGAGSGVDVAAALAGGVLGISFTAPGTPPRIEPLVWPRQLHLLAGWTGQSASTPAMLGRLAAYGEREPAIHGGHLRRLGAVTGRVLEAWRLGQVPAILDRLADFGAALRRLDGDADLGIYTGGHETLRRLAEERGVVYKPSGAGGGDFGIALSDSPRTLDDLAAAWRGAGFLCLEAGLCAPGLGVRAGPARTVIA